MKPLFSIFMFTKNDSRYISRAIKSVLSQSYKNIEFVIQDGGSTDGTQDIIAKTRDSRIKLISEPDQGSDDAFWKCFKRCSGEFIGSCLSDEELLPASVQQAVDLFKKHPHAACITRDVYFMDDSGKITGKWLGSPFDLFRCLVGWRIPMLLPSYYRKTALVDIGLFERSWQINCGEFELWVRLGLRHRIQYIRGISGKYTIRQKDQGSFRPDNLAKLLDGRLEVIERIVRETPQFERKEVLEYQLKVLVYLFYKPYLDNMDNLNREKSREIFYSFMGGRNFGVGGSEPRKNIRGGIE